MVAIVAAGIVGGACSFAVLLPFGWVLALLGMPLGGSLSGFAAACLVGHGRTGRGLNIEKGLPLQARGLDAPKGPVRA